MNKSIIGGLAMAIATTAGGVDLVQAWDKTFPKSGNVEHSKVTFKNRFGITLAADVYKPKDVPPRTIVAGVPAKVIKRM